MHPRSLLANTSLVGRVGNDLIGRVSNSLVSRPAARPPASLEIVHQLPKTVESRIVQLPHGITTRTRHIIENLMLFLKLNSVEPCKPPVHGPHSGRTTRDGLRQPQTGKVLLTAAGALFRPP